MRDECCAGLCLEKNLKDGTHHTVTVILSTNAADVVRWLNSLTSLDKICEA